MQYLPLSRQKTVAQCCVYAACWLGTGLGLYWIWDGILLWRPDTPHDQFANPFLIVLGLVVLAGVYGLYKMQRAAAVLLLLYALLQEAILQHYNYTHFGRIIFKPYFPAEVAGLVLALIGVFWYHAAVNKLAAHDRRPRRLSKR